MRLIVGVIVLAVLAAIAYFVLYDWAIGLMWRD